MSPLTWQRIAVVLLTALALTWTFTAVMAGRGFTPVAVPWTVILISLAAGALALGFAWPVRQYVRGHRPRLDAIRAARTAAFAQACAYGGAVMAGAYGGYALGLALEWGHAPRREVAVLALVAAVGALALTAAGWLAESWCRIDGTHGEDDADAEVA